MEQKDAATVAKNLELRNDVRRAVSTWDDCDIAVLVEDGTDVGPIRRGLQVVGVDDFAAAPFTLFRFNL